MNPIAVLPRRVLMSPLLGLLLLLYVSMHPVIAQQVQNQLKPVSLSHLYWHFLIHQSELDALAAKLDAKRQGGDAIRNDLQRQLGFTDAEYAPIQASSKRLAAELKPIEAKLRSLQGPAWNSSEAMTLIAEREIYIDREINTLSTELSPQNKAKLEKFMTQFFAPKNISAAIAAASSGQGVQQ